MGVIGLKLKGNLFLLAAAFIWGTTFVAQLVGMDELGPFGYCSARYIIASVAIMAVWLAFKGQRQKKIAAGAYIAGWKYGLGAGCIMLFATSMQQMALQYTSAGKTAFITCLYIMLVPLFAVFLKKKVYPENWAGAALAIGGLYCLCVKEALTLGYGDILAILNAVGWTFHILYIDRFAAKADNIELAAAQLMTCAVGSTILALVFEDIVFSSIINSWFPIMYAGVMSSTIAFTLQIVGQKYSDPGPAAIIMSMESVFGALSGWVILGETMSSVEITGCILMAAGMLVTQCKQRN